MRIKKISNTSVNRMKTFWLKTYENFEKSGLLSMLEDMFEVSKYVVGAGKGNRKQSCGSEFFRG